MTAGAKELCVLLQPVTELQDENRSPQPHPGRLFSCYLVLPTNKPGQSDFRRQKYLIPLNKSRKTSYAVYCLHPLLFLMCRDSFPVLGVVTSPDPSDAYTELSHSTGQMGGIIPNNLI